MKSNPSSDYNTLLRQYNALRTLVKALESEISFYRRKDYALAEKRLEELERDLESEREMNAILTEELEECKKNG